MSDDKQPSPHKDEPFKVDVGGEHDGGEVNEPADHVTKDVRRRSPEAEQGSNQNAPMVTEMPADLLSSVSKGKPSWNKNRQAQSNSWSGSGWGGSASTDQWKGSSWWSR